MTYRRLYRYLFILATLVLVVAWGQSLRGYTAVMFAPLSHLRGLTPAIGVDLCQGTLGVSMSHAGSWPRVLDAGFTPDSEGSISGGLSPFGKFGIRQVMGWLLISFPVWVPWLVFVSAGFVLCRWMEKRSARDAEKKLAQHDPADRVNETHA